MRKRKPRPMPYHGGKGRGKAEWICRLLPGVSERQLYIEPYGGMAGVMMVRQPATIEIYNDLNGRLVNWWRIVRDEPTEFARLVEWTPWSEELYEEAVEQVDDESLPPIRRALAFHILLMFGVQHGGGAISGAFYMTYHTGRAYPAYRLNTHSRIHALAQRMRYVQMSRRPAIKILKRVSRLENAVIYCDPPYPSADSSPYMHGDIDKDELTEALLAQRGFCAISGYGDEWDHLGWRCEQRSAWLFGIASKVKGARRIEKLWLNQRSEQRLF